MSHYEDLRTTTRARVQQVIKMDVITTEFRQMSKPQQEKKDRGKKKTFEERIQLRG